MGVDLFRADGRTDGHTDDTTKLIVSFYNFTHAPNNQTKKKTSTGTEFSLPAALLTIIQLKKKLQQHLMVRCISFPSNNKTYG